MNDFKICWPIIAVDRLKVSKGKPVRVYKHLQVLNMARYIKNYKIPL